MHSLPLGPSYTLPGARYAVLLNRNAGRVTPRLARQLGAIVRPERLVLTECPAHAREVLRRCVEDEIDTVFAGGGDGTIVDVVNHLAELRGDAPRLPDVGVLRLGTGNALAHWLGSGRPARDLRRWAAGRVHRRHPVQMVQADGRRTPFAGLGFDAAIVNDYAAVKGAAAGRWWEPLARGLPGYLLAGYLRTLPDQLRRPINRVCITNLGGPALAVDIDGRPTGAPVPPGGVLYEGPASFVGAATTPLYGYGMRMFPHATRRAGRFHLRVSRLGALATGLAVPRLWDGTRAVPRIDDWWADRVRVCFADAMPFQVGGDAAGHRREVVLGLDEVPTLLLGQA